MVKLGWYALLPILIFLTIRDAKPGYGGNTMKLFRKKQNRSARIGSPIGYSGF